MLIVSSFLFLNLSACAYSVHQVHTSDFSPGASLQNGSIVKAQAEQFVILGFTTQTDYVNQGYTKLMAACPQGAITGITTQLATNLGLFSWTNKVLMQGLCVQPKVASLK